MSNRSGLHSLSSLDDMIKKDKRSNGNGKQVPEVLVHAISTNIKAEQALTSIKNSIRGNIAEEKTKFTVAEGLHNDEKIPHFTEYRNFDETLRMNKIEMWSKLAPLVFGDSPTTRQVLSIVEHHITVHKKNMRSYQRKGEKAIVDILRADSGELPTASFIKKFTGVGR